MPADMIDLVSPIIRSALPELVAIRRDFHAHPELAFEEHRTSDRIASILSGWGIPVDRTLCETGVVGILRGGTSSRAIGLRADIDGLPMTELNRFDHASTVAGRMHGCGHDGHTAMLLAAAKHLSGQRSFEGTVYLIFQPAEEGGAAGARALIRAGLFERFPMDAIFGMHNWPDLPAGQFAVHSGPVFASGNKFAVTVGGRGGHAAMPHKTVDPIPAACQLVTALQSVVARNVDPLEGAVVSVTNIHGGEAVNVIPNSCEIKGTVRTFSIQALDLIEQRIETISRGLCDSFGASCEFAFDRYYPPTINHTDESDFVRTTLASNGYDCAPAEFPPTFCSEDFGYYLLEKPGCYFLIGNGQGNSIERDGMGSLHSANYDFNDKIIGVGGAAWVKLCEVWFDRINQVDSAGT